MENLAEKIIEASRTSFIDLNYNSEESIRPKLLFNDVHKGSTVLASIEQEILNCESFWFSVAFITKSGLIVLKEALKKLQQKTPKVRGRILTTDYLLFNEPDALRDLLKYSNINVRVFTEERFHTKGYMFSDDEKKTFIVGSSNLTQTALKVSKEWNLKVTSLEQGELIKETNAEFENMWSNAQVLTEQWISEEYEVRYKEQKKIRNASKKKRIHNHFLNPNSMQEEAIRALANLREQNEKKGLIISATGTGKTYLSAFDVRNFKPKKMLFLAHREQILRQALNSYKDILGEGIYAGLLSGNRQDFDADYLFSTIQKMSKDIVLHSYSPRYFDYIIIDETHKAGADSYKKLIDYFQPQFMLGMTASPERTDGYDIYQLFDHNIAYEIRLQKAMEEGLLCPFHYFGLTELEVNGHVIDDNTEFRHLVSSERVDNILSQAEYYGYSGERVKGLVYCSTNHEAAELSKLFNQRGYKTLALSGANSQEEREQAIIRLEQNEWEGRLDYIFTVDIFNEGVDIPTINQIIMLRPTESAIVFIQQLGRGLRKSEGKEYLVVLDFIGNYQKNFLIPIALSGDRTFNKDTIRRYISEGNRIIPGCSTVNFDEIAKERIYKSIDSNNLTTFKILKKEYNDLKGRIGRIPTLLDFYVNGSIDPLIIIEKYKSYYVFLKKVDKEYTISLNEDELTILEYVSTQFANGKRPHELVLLEELMQRKCCSVKRLEDRIAEEYGIINDHKSVEKAFCQVNGEFLKGVDKVKYADCKIIDYSCNENYIEGQQKNQFSVVRIAKYYLDCMNNSNLREMIQNIITLGLDIYKKKYVNRYKGTNLVLYEKYSRRDACRLLNWDSDESSTIYGYKIKHNTCIIFVTYNKSDNISNSTKYKDQFVNPYLFSWMTRNNVHWNSKEPIAIFNHKELDMDIHLFIKKADGEGLDFYYMGTVEPIKESSNETRILNDNGVELPVVNIMFRMNDIVRDDIYEYLTR